MSFGPVFEFAFMAIRAARSFRLIHAQIAIPQSMRLYPDTGEFVITPMPVSPETQETLDRCEEMERRYTEALTLLCHVEDPHALRLAEAALEEVGRIAMRIRLPPALPPAPATPTRTP